MKSQACSWRGEDGFPCESKKIRIVGDAVTWEAQQGEVFGLRPDLEHEVCLLDGDC
jgi:hypothetical protein